MPTTFDYKPQSYKWSSYRVVIDDAVEVKNDQAHNVRLAKREAGRLTEYTLTPGGGWHGCAVKFAGVVSVSSVSKNDAVIALASRSSWSGGSNLEGWVFGKPGAVILFSCKGDKQWYVFGEDGVETVFVKPGTVPVEL